jgi:hypothetical protein
MLNQLMMKMMLLKVIQQHHVMISSLIEKIFSTKIQNKLSFLFNLLMLNEEDLDLLMMKIFVFDYLEKFFLDLVPVLQLMHELI